MSTTVRQRLRHRQQLGTHIPTQNPEEKKIYPVAKQFEKDRPTRFNREIGSYRRRLI